MVLTIQSQNDLDHPVWMVVLITQSGWWSWSLSLDGGLDHPVWLVVLITQTGWWSWSPSLDDQPWAWQNDKRIGFSEQCCTDLLPFFAPTPYWLQLTVSYTLMLYYAFSHHHCPVHHLLLSNTDRIRGYQQSDTQKSALRQLISKIIYWKLIYMLYHVSFVITIMSVL